MTRHKFNYVGFFLICLLVVFIYNCKAPRIKNSEDIRAHSINTIVDQIKTPDIGTAVVNISDFGAVGDGLFDCRPAITKAIQKVSASGGGKIVFPKGTYFCKGPIHLKSKINIHFNEGSTIVFSEDAKDYLPLQLVRWEGVEIYNYSPYIYAINEKDIAITGTGTLNGNAIEQIGKWKQKQKPAQNLSRLMGKDLVPVKERIFGEGHFLRMSFIQFMNCSNILIKDISIENVPFWVIHPTYSDNITIKNVNVNCPKINNDGIDVDSSQDVFIENCKFNAGDDAIAIKSGRDQDGWRVNKPSKNVVIRNCFAENVLHGLAFGSEMSGGMENIYIDNFFMRNVKQYAIQFKANKDRGGYIRNVFIDGVFIDSTKTAILFTNNYHSYSGGESPSEFHNIKISNLTCNYANGSGIDIQGLEEKPIHHLTFKNILIHKEEKTSILLNVEASDFDNININDKPLSFE